MKKRQRYIKRCKDAAWNRWNKEYLHSLRERHTMKNNQRHTEIEIGDVVLIKGNDKRRGKWNIFIVDELHEGKDIPRHLKIFEKFHLNLFYHHLNPLDAVYQ